MYYPRPKPHAWKAFAAARKAPLGFALIALLAGCTALAGCSSSPSGPPGSKSAGSKSAGSKSAGSKSAGSKSVPAPAMAPVLAIIPSDGTAKVRLNKKIKIKASQGTITQVTVATKSGKHLKGSLSADRLTWTSKTALAAATSYHVTVQAAGADGRTTARTSTFRTLTPNGSATGYIQPSTGMTVGVGMPIVVNLSRSVTAKHRNAVEKALTVTSTPTVTGAWHWMSSTQVQWRPAKYWPTRTKVKVSENLGGVELSAGVWGNKTKRTSKFSIGSAMIDTVDVAHHTLTVRRNGKVLRVIPVTTGKAGLATRNGIKVIMSRESVHEMDSTSIGIPKGSPGYYDIVARYAMRLTNSGEFLHAAPWSTGAQGHANVSHGCTGMSTEAAAWLFSRSKMGDVVVFKNSNRKLEWGNGLTAWNEPFSKWKA